MSTKHNPTSTQHFAAYHRDGLIDIFFGLFLLFAGAALWTELTFMAGIWAAILVPLWISARSSITRRRVRQPAAPKGPSGMFMISMMGLFTLGVLAILVFTVGLSNLPELRDFLASYIHLTIGGAIAVVLLFLAAGLSTPRLVLHALACVAVFIIGETLTWPFFISMSVVGAVTFAGGSIVLAKFLREHPEIS